MTATPEYCPEQLLPHQGKSCLLDAIEGHGPNWIASRIDITERSPFFQNGGVPAWVAVEYMAQTGAAFYGLLRRRQGLKPKVALLLGTRRFRCEVPEFLPGSLHVHARIELLEEEGMAAFFCELRQQDRSLGNAILKAYRPENLLQFIDQPAEPDR